LFPASEIDDYIDEGLVEDRKDWFTLHAKAEEHLSHKHSERCKRRVGDGNTETEKDYVCRKTHPVLGRENPMVHELKPLPHKFSDICLDILQECDLWEPPTPDFPKGRFWAEMLEPKKHLGAVHPGARCKMSPVIDKWFAATRSMQNQQILNGTNGVARYVVKYIVKLN